MIGFTMSRICFITLGDMEKMPTAKRAAGMASELVRLGHRVAIVAWDVPSNHVRLAMECPEAEPLWVSPRNIVLEIMNKIKVVRDWRPELIYLSSFGIRNLACLRPLYSRNAKVIAEHCELYSAFGDLKHRMDLKWLEKRSVVEANGLVCASRYLQAEFDRRIKQRGSHARTVYLPYAYPSYLALQGGGDKPVSGKKRILFMAALWKNYGVLDVIRAAKILVAQRADFVVDILGDGPAREEAALLIRELGLEDRVFLKGFIPETDLSQDFSRASVFLAPLVNTIQDIARCPSKVYYYLPYQKPIVTCALGDPHELLKSDGYYYIPASVESMAEVLNRALDESAGFVFRSLSVAEHSWNYSARQFEGWCKENGWIR
jgi:glycosyltransferase involved in cell wall biosynthesis